MDTRQQETRQQDTADLATLQAEIRQLREQLAQLSNPATSQSSQQDARNFARELQQELRGTLDSARDRGKDLLDQARNQGDKAIDELEQKIGQYPLLSLFLVFLAGVLLGKLFDRRG